MGPGIWTLGSGVQNLGSGVWNMGSESLEVQYYDMFLQTALSCRGSGGVVRAVLRPPHRPAE